MTPRRPTPPQAQPTLPPEKALPLLKKQLEVLQGLKNKHYQEGAQEILEWRHFVQSIVERTFGNPSSNLTKFEEACGTGEFWASSMSDADFQEQYLAQIHGFEAFVRSSISELEILLPQHTNEEMKEDARMTAEASDQRRVFVVHGRNMEARDAMFTFLRAIDLDPIEWEEAIAMTGEGTPYIGDAIDIAFTNAQAAVILLTGDDMVRLGRRYLSDHDPADEKHLSPQARPNVLFEMGMAFGKYPHRTVIVALGATRQFSDTVGRPHHPSFQQG